MSPTNTWRLALLAAIAVAGVGCFRTDVCAGAPTCFGAKAEQCQSVPGCAPTPGCVNDPLLGVDCTSPATEAACVAVGYCVWSGGLCGEACGRLADQATCAANRPCMWSACSGNAKACRSYSADECPISPIGCYVDPGN